MNVMETTPAGKEILKMNRNSVGEHSYVIEFDKAIHPAVTSDTNLDVMNKLLVQKISKCLDNLASRIPKTVKLFEWVRMNIA